MDDVTATGPNQPWVGDITVVPTADGFLDLAVVLDAWRRKIVGRATASHLRAELVVDALVVDALEMAVGQRRPGDVIHRSDQGSRHTSLASGKRCKEAGVRPSMGSAGDADDDAGCESVFATLGYELLDRRRFASQAEARMACFSVIEGLVQPPNGDPMTEESLPLAELMQKARDPDFLRTVAEAVLQPLMEVDVDGVIGAGLPPRADRRSEHLQQR